MKNKFYILLLVVLFIQGCKENYNSDNSLAIIQSGYSSINPEKNEAVCYYLGNIDFPYIDQETNANQDKYDTWVNNELTRRLNVFNQLNLLNKNKDKDKDKDNSSLIQYDLTSEGSKYYREKYKGFCFGNLIFEKTDQPVKEYDTEVIITYNYHLENIPSWATNPIFTDYFYYGKEIGKEKDANGDRKYFYVRAEKYPYLTGETNQTEIYFSKIADGGIVYTKLFMPHLYAFYDYDVGIRTEDRKRRNVIIGWGVDDPILEQVDPR